MVDGKAPDCKSRRKWFASKVLSATFCLGPAAVTLAPLTHAQVVEPQTPRVLITSRVGPIADLNCVLTPEQRTNKQSLLRAQADQIQSALAEANRQLAVLDDNFQSMNQSLWASDLSMIGAALATLSGVLLPVAAPTLSATGILTGSVNADLAAGYGARTLVSSIPGLIGPSITTVRTSPGATLDGHVDLDSMGYLYSVRQRIRRIWSSGWIFSDRHLRFLSSGECGESNCSTVYPALETIWEDTGEWAREYWEILRERNHLEGSRGGAWNWFVATFLEARTWNFTALHGRYAVPFAIATKLLLMNRLFFNQGLRAVLTRDQRACQFASQFGFTWEQIRARERAAASPTPATSPTPAPTATALPQTPGAATAPPQPIRRWICVRRHTGITPAPAACENPNRLGSVEDRPELRPSGCNGNELVFSCTTVNRVSAGSSPGFRPAPRALSINP